MALATPSNLPPTSASAFPIDWQQGEHMAIVGDTGTGKTYLLSQIVPFRDFVVIFRTKPDDIKFRGFRRVRTAAAMDDARYSHLLLEPKYEAQFVEGARMLEKAWQDGGWTVVIDELWYAERIGLGRLIEKLLTQGRSKRITVVVGMQRPVQVSRFALSQCTHMFAFRTERRDGKVLVDAFSDSLKPFTGNAQALRKHEFVYYNRATGAVARGKAQHVTRLFRKRAAIDGSDLPG